MTVILLSAFIEGDLTEIADYIAADNPRQAVTFIRTIRQKFLEIAKTPLIYRPRPEVGKDARLAFVGDYAILFRVVPEGVKIERVAHGARDLKHLADS